VSGGDSPLRVLVVGCGHMGASHARAYHRLPGFEPVGLVARGGERRGPLAAELGGVAEFDDVHAALAETAPDAVCIATYPDTHAPYALAAFEAGAHVFLEKPLAATVEEAQQVVDAAVAAGRKLAVGYILRHHPSWTAFIAEARKLGKPLVMRMNLNQQSAGDEWRVHRNLMASLTPIVDCGVHYVDVMCQATRARPTQVYAIGARLSDEVAQDNYGMLQVRFDDDSVGWYEAGWGPMMSQEASFVKDIVGPEGSVSIVKPVDSEAVGGSADIDSHTQTNTLLVHRGALAADGGFAHADRRIDTADEPDHQKLCNREQAWFETAIREDRDLADHMADAVNSLRIVLAADRSVRERRAVDL